MILIGLTGPRQSGKSTAAEYLRAHHGAVEVAFADPLYQALADHVSSSERFQHLSGQALLDAVKAWANDPDVKEHAQSELEGISPRAFLNAEGDHLLDIFGRDYLIARVRRRVATLAKTKGVVVVVSDVRDDREAEFVRVHSGQVAHLLRDTAHFTRDHRTDYGVSRRPCDQILSNSRTKASLYSQIDALVAAMKRSRGRA